MNPALVRAPPFSPVVHVFGCLSVYFVWLQVNLVPFVRVGEINGSLGINTFFFLLSLSYWSCWCFACFCYLTNSGENKLNQIFPAALQVYRICTFNTSVFLFLVKCVNTLIWLRSASLGYTFLVCVPAGRHQSFHTRLPSPGSHQSFQLRLAFPWGNQ